jgi:acetate kinase
LFHRKIFPARSPPYRRDETTTITGENDGDIRERVCTGLERLGIRLDPQANAEPSGEARRIEATGAEVALLVVPTGEELEIAMQTVECLEGN